jgi:sigma-B regulation protein RsbU (phosphoserine phosphatase)
VQQELLPQEFPQVLGVEIFGTLLQGRFVGGDYYDFLPLSATSLLAVVADVSGKGVPAALIMSKVRASTHLLASMQMTLEELVQRLNALLFKSIERKYFVSFFAAEIDTKQKMMYYVNAGHPPPLVCSHGRISALSHGSLVLGVRASLPRLAKQFVPFPRGGMLVAFTDGICERMNGRGEQFGDHRLEKFVQHHAELNAPLFVAQLLEEVKSFGQGKARDDDVAIAVAKFC